MERSIQLNEGQRAQIAPLVKHFQAAQAALWSHLWLIWGEVDANVRFNFDEGRLWLPDARDNVQRSIEKLHGAMDHANV